MALIKQDAAPPRETSSPQTATADVTAGQGARTPAKTSRTMWDTIVSGAGAVVAIALLVIGAAAVYGGNFGRDNVQDRLQPEKVIFPPLDAMTPAEQQTSESSQARRSIPARRQKASPATSEDTSPK